MVQKQKVVSVSPQGSHYFMWSADCTKKKIKQIRAHLEVAQKVTYFNQIHFNQKNSKISSSSLIYSLLNICTSTFPTHSLTAFKCNCHKLAVHVSISLEEIGYIRRCLSMKRSRNCLWSSSFVRHSLYIMIRAMPRSALSLTTFISVTFSFSF